jgi:hypothetical protein
MAADAGHVLVGRRLRPRGIAGGDCRHDPLGERAVQRLVGLRMGIGGGPHGVGGLPAWMAGEGRGVAA